MPAPPKKNKNKKAKNQPQRSQQSTKAPVALGTVMRTPAYKFSTSGRSITINHREYLSSLVTTNVALEPVQCYVVNAADFTSFPWLFSLARNFSRYRLKALKVLYVSEAATTTTGTVMMAYSPDPSVFTVPPASKVAMMQYESSVRCAPWENATMTCRVDGAWHDVKAGNNYGVNQGSVISSLNIVNITDVRNVADGAILLSASNVAAATIGDIFIDYTIELAEPMGSLCRPVGGAQCATTASSLFSTGSNLIRAASEVSILFTATTITFTFTGECFVYIGYTGSATATMANATVSTGCTLVATSNIVNTVTPFNSALLLSLSCTGLTTITQGASANLAASTTKVYLLPNLSGSFAAQIFP